MCALATECPWISAEFLEQERQEGEEKFRQEYMCEFVDSDEYVFPRELVERCISDEVRPLFR